MYWWELVGDLGLYIVSYIMKVLAEVMELLVSVLLVCGLCDATQDAKRLHDILLRKRTYNKLVQPRMDSPLTVKMGLKLAQIIDVVSVQ